MTTVLPDPPAQRPLPALAEHDALAAGTRFGEFEIIRVLGVGGFGIVYLAQDHSLERLVALKEYMPASLAARGEGPAITVRSGAFAETYAMGLRSFINEARLLARFDHPSLVKVYRFWEDNATAYMVMPYLQGITLRDLRRSMTDSPDEAWIRAVLEPMLAALDLLHREGIYHRDIAPDNILLPPAALSESPPILLDFGAARRVISDRTQSLTAILKPSYAPIEQYAEMTQLRQGPWTDLYALGAVMHFLLFGQPPAPATARAVQDQHDGIDQRQVPGVSPRFLAIVGWMLAVRPNERPQNVEALRAALEGRTAVPEPTRRDVTVPGDTALMSVAATPRSSAPFAPTMLLAANALAPTQIDTSRLPTEIDLGRRPGSAPAVVPALGAMPPVRPRAAPPAAPAPSRQRLLMAALAGIAVLLLGSFWFVIGERGAAPVSSQAASAVPLAASAASAALTVSPALVAAGAASAPAATASAPVLQVEVPALAMPAVSPVAASVPTGSASAAKARQVARAASRAADLAASAARAAEAMPVAAAPSPAPSPVVETPVLAAAPAGPATAREACGGRVFIALAVCMDRECEQPRFRDHPDCQRVLAMKRKREPQ